MLEDHDRADRRREAMPVGGELPKLAYSISQAAEASGLSRAFIYAEWQAGRGPRKVKAGKRTLIMVDALRSWLASLEIGSDP